MSKSENIKVSCFHEAGHLIALHHLGGVGFIRFKEKKGSVEIHHNPKDRESIRIVGLAGAIAEYIFVGTLAGRSALTLETLCQHLMRRRMSDTDKAAAEGYTDATVQSTIDLLTQHWAEVEFAAGWEIDKLMEVAQ